LSGCPDTRTAWILISLICLLFLPAGSAGAEAVSGKGWQTVETRYATIHFLSSEDLKVFDSKLNYSAGEGGFLGLFSFSRDGKDLGDTTAKKVDAIYQRVQEILDMKRSMRKIVINVYHDTWELQAVFTRIYQRPCRIRAWYRFLNNTVYVNARDLNEGMLAHEMAHSIIDNYMTVRPPRATAEILARYVDQHLEE
jgi:hypothetical protein